MFLISILQWIPNIDTQANLATYISAHECAKDYFLDLLTLVYLSYSPYSRA